jgi:flagellin-like protein
MFSKRKGITPVIAIVLLLLITVGAVGVVYTQFQSLTSGNEAEKELEKTQKIQQSSYSIIGTYVGGANYKVTLKNTGDTTLDLTQSSTLMIGKNGGEPVAVSLQGNECSFGSLAPGQDATCNTGVPVGGFDDGASTTIQLKVGEAIKTSYSCTEKSGQNYC